MANGDPYYIHAEAAPVSERTRVLKHGETFAVLDPRGDVQLGGLREQGIFHEGTRYLSHYVLRLGPRRPFLLSSAVLENNTVLAVDFTNPDFEHQGVLLPRGTVHLLRTKFLMDGRCLERLRFTNYGTAPLELTLLLEFAFDFNDIFEVRGMHRKARGELMEPVLSPLGVEQSYLGLDGVVRTSRLLFQPPAEELTPGQARLRVRLAPGEELVQNVQLVCGEQAPAGSYDEALAALSQERSSSQSYFCGLQTSNAQFNHWLDRSIEDLRMMITRTSVGPFPYAGVPWFSAPFGRDALTTGLQTLWVNPGLSAGILRYLALTQARTEAPEQDAQPGKILHEARGGEMAALMEVPFARYYGSVDSTPLFVLLAAEYFAATGDRPLLEGLWPSIEAALGWMERTVKEGGGFLRYLRHSTKGLQQQGWKDSSDSVFHQDGQLAEGPIALCEVQGYAYAAWKGAAALARALHLEALARSLESSALGLQQRFERDFWVPELSTYALALDGAGRACRIRSSNAGQVLFSGIASAERATQLVASLFDEAGFSGWGIRTVAAGQPRYNPMAYHNGSIWPHDNALIAAGASLYGDKSVALTVLSSLFDASRHMERWRLPELFCGFQRRPGEGPTLYPVACSPQVWASGSVLLLLKACLGLKVDASHNRVSFERPVLPDFLRELRLRDLQVGQGRISLSLHSYPGNVGINVDSRVGPVEVAILK